MSAPEGYKLYTGSSPAVTAKAVALLSQDYGYQELTFLDGKKLLFVVETHTQYGAQPDKPPNPHKGVTVYEALLYNPFPPTAAPLVGLALIGLGYLLWRQS